MREISIYVHIPFCKQKCFYCAFNSFCADEKTRQRYVDLLCEEIRRRKEKNCVVKTIYIGGGTPSLLSAGEIEKIVGAIYENFDVYDNAEFTIEANPESLSEEILKVWKNLRVSRVSLGIQSLSDKTLKKIGRLHNKKTALDAVKLARKYFDNVSCDLIVGLEGETGKDLTSYAKNLLELGIKHISCYLLEVYDATPLGKLVEGKKYLPQNDENTILAFNKLSNFLVDNGFERYEISNFALPGYESKHNLNYWARGEYLGFGISAHSFFDGVRRENAATLAEYERGTATLEKLTEKDVIEEKIMLGLRCNLGVSLPILGYEIEKNPYFEEYLSQGILIKEGQKLLLNPLFYHLSNTIISNLLPN